MNDPKNNSPEKNPIHINEQYMSEQYPELPPTAKESYVHISRDGQVQERDEPVLNEHLLQVYINERLTMQLVCIPQYLAELVLGRLFTEGIIRNCSEIQSIYICASGTRAKVYLADQSPREHEDFVELTPTCCTGNHILNDDFTLYPDLRPVDPIPWKASWVFALADRFSEGMPLHSKTWCTHSCFLAREDQILFQCEDIGRHNALDKAIGYALRHNIDLAQCLIYSSGRIPTDMAVKAIRAGIPILSAKASPTRQAVRLAKDYGLTLVCAARRDRMKLYAGDPPSENF